MQTNKRESRGLPQPSQVLLESYAIGSDQDEASSVVLQLNEPEDISLKQGDQWTRVFSRD